MKKNKKCGKTYRPIDEKYSLVGVDGNAFAIMGYVFKAMRREGYSREEIEAYYNKATSSDYDNLIMESITMIEKLNEK